MKYAISNDSEGIVILLTSQQTTNHMEYNNNK